jgi:hypothetical protein
LEAKLSSEITSEVGITDNRETSLTSKTTVSYELPPRPTDKSTFIQARNYQYAPTYRRVRLEIERNCHACGSNERSIVIALFATGRFATRHEEFLNTSEKQVKPTGFVRLDNLQQASGGA